MDGQERDIPSRESIATSGPDTPSDTPTVLDDPGGVLGGCELLVEDVIELGDPTFITQEVTHGIWFVVSALQRTRQLSAAYQHFQRIPRGVHLR
jgi:hypothetical protein